MKTGRLSSCSSGGMNPMGDTLNFWELDEKTGQITPYNASIIRHGK
jgi:hypothetical protein